ncbi:MAG: sulfotransferase [Chloroflexi bacterium]|nr:sulfotransferase [Chloroflexota bacterium]
MFSPIVFCVGLQRSGTTALSRFLEEHPQIQQPPNRGDKRECNQPCWGPLNAVVQRKGVHIVEPDDLSLVQMVSLKLRIYRELRPGRTFFIKTPKNCVRIRMLKHIFPSSRIVFIKRDPRSILRSWWASKGYHHLTSGYYQHPYYRKQSDGLYYWQPPPLQDADVSGWSYPRIQKRLRSITGDTRWWDTAEAFEYRMYQLDGALAYHLDHRAEIPVDDYLELSYDDLCERPEGELEKLYEFMGVTKLNIEHAETFFSSQDYKFTLIDERYQQQAEDFLKPVGERMGYSW